MPVAIKTSDMQTAANLTASLGLEMLTTRIAEAVATERERIAQLVERADNAMMNQDKLAAYIRGLRRG